MTRQEFIDTVDDFDSLMDFARESGYEFEDVHTEEAYDDCINEELSDIGGHWTGIRDWLNSLPTDGYFYTHDYNGDWEGRNEYDIEDLKNDFLDWADDRDDIFDPEEEEEEEEGPTPWDDPPEQELPSIPGTPTPIPTTPTPDETPLTLDDLLKFAAAVYASATD